MEIRVAVAFLCLGLAGCLDASVAPSTNEGPRHAAPPVRRLVDLDLGAGHTRAGFTTGYPGGSFTILTAAPRGARYHVVLDVAGIRVDGFPRFRRDACTLDGTQLVCRAGPFEAIPKGYGPWRLTVVKTSAPPARVRIRLRFVGTSTGA